MSRYGAVIYFGILFIYQCGSEVSKPTIKEQIKAYDTFVKKSQAWSKRDHILLKTWDQDFQLRQVNVTAEYRMKVKIHRRWSFKRVEYNNKWTQYVDLYTNEIDRDESTYYEGENKCLESAYSTNNHELETYTQLEKEIKKWRKSYKYLKNLCKSENSNSNEEFAQCLVEYVRKDKFDEVFTRLRSMKLEVMENIVSKQKKALVDLEDCLRKTFSNYLDKVRSLKSVLNICYDKMNFNTSTEDSN